MQSLYVQVKGPAAPGDAVSQLCLFPAYGGVDGRDEQNEEHGLLLPGCLRQHCQKVVDIEPCFVAVLLKQCMCDAKELAPNALAPICAEFGAKVADSVVVELCFYAEEKASLFCAVHFHAFMRCFEVQ